MDSASFQQLLTPAGQEVLRSAEALSPKEYDFLIHYQTLSRRYSAELTRLALEIAILRGNAWVKFPFADQLYLTRTALEQASSYEVSAYRAGRYRPYDRVVDLGCSIGGDTFALALTRDQATTTIGFDIDSLRLQMAAANLKALGLAAQLIQADLTNPLPLQPGSAALFFDPARRADHQRFFSVQQYRPPLAVIRSWLPNFPALGVKISPGVNIAELVEYDAEIEFISLRGELKEAALWFGPLKSALRRATILPGPHQLASTSQNQPASIIAEPKAYLYEPDPAVLRAGLVTTLAERLNASQLDSDIAYLTADTLTYTPFARAWAIVDWFPFQLKRLRTYLRQHSIGQVTVKKRGSPLEPETLIHQLRLQGDQQCVLVLTHLRGEPIVMVCNEL